ncbi:hypothetical protein KKG83_00955 [Candidatus Micrarchaeota archaeon]|nr:hypothetical protein [Candidatus Micrarchaeota archaeon]
MDLIYFFAPLILCLIGIYFFDKISRKKNFVLGTDINKKTLNKTPEATGLILLIVLWVFVLGKGLIDGIELNILYWLGMVTVFSLVGFIDDTRTKWTKKELGWGKRAVPILLLSVLFGFLVSGEIISGILLGIFVAVFSSFHNTFAGLNGWEVGSSYIIALIAAFLLIGTMLFVYSVAVSALILALLVFNIYPAKVFPGDSGTLFMGSTITGLIALTLNKELLFLFSFFYLPHLIDFLFLKMLTNPEDPTQIKIKPYKLLENGKLGMPDYKGKKRYDFAKLIIRIFGPLKEWQIVLINWIVVGLNCFIWLIVFNAITL